MRLKLSTAAVRKAIPPPTGYHLWWDSELCGFGLRVTASGARCFIVEKRVHGRTRRVSLGRWPAVTVAAARKRARVHLGKVAAGVDPTAERSRETLVTITLVEAFRDYVTLKRRSKDGKSLKARTQTDMMASCDTVLKGWKQRALISLTRPIIEQRYREECERSVVQANMGMKYLRAVFNFTAERQVDSDGRPLLADNPVNVLRHQWRGVPRRKRVMSAEELQRWVPAVLGLGQAPIRPRGAGKLRPKLRHGEVYRDLLLFLALTGCRPDEARHVAVADVDWQADEVTFRDTKNRLDHTLPLTAYLRELLRHRVSVGKSSRLFSSPYDGRSLSNYRTAVKRVREASAVHFTLQDLRRLAATAMERGRVPVYTIKAVLNHLSGNDVTAGYVQVGRDMKLAALHQIEAFVLAAERSRGVAGMGLSVGGRASLGTPVHLQCAWRAKEEAGPPTVNPSAWDTVMSAPDSDPIEPAGSPLGASRLPMHSSSSRSA